MSQDRISSILDATRATSKPSGIRVASASAKNIKATSALARYLNFTRHLFLQAAVLGLSLMTQQAMYVCSCNAKRRHGYVLSNKYPSLLETFLVEHLTSKHPKGFNSYASLISEIRVSSTCEWHLFRNL